MIQAMFPLSAVFCALGVLAAAAVGEAQGFVAGALCGTPFTIIGGALLIVHFMEKDHQ